MIFGRRALWATAVMAAILGLGFTATAATAARGKTLGGVVADVPTGHHSPPTR